MISYERCKMVLIGLQKHGHFGLITNFVKSILSKPLTLQLPTNNRHRNGQT